MTSHPKWRLRARAALEAYFHRHSFPRLTLGLIVALAGFAGFLISHALLYLGFVEMWLRYPLAVLGGYGVFLVLLRLWVEIERIRYDPKMAAVPTDASDGKIDLPIRRAPFEKDRSSWLDWLDVPELFAFEEGCLLGCVIALVVGLVAGVTGLLFSFVMAGSELLAEVCLDAFVVSLLYRHLKTAASEHWLGTAVKRTWISASLMAAGLGLFGYFLGLLAPQSHSLGPALEAIFRGP